MDFPGPRIDLVKTDHVHLQHRDDPRTRSLLLSGIDAAADKAFLFGIEQDEPDGARQRRCRRQGDELLGRRQYGGNAAGIVVGARSGAMSLIEIGIVRGGGIEMCGHQHQLRTLASQLRFDVVQGNPAMRELNEAHLQATLADFFQFVGKRGDHALIVAIEVRQVPAADSDRIGRAQRPDARVALDALDHCRRRNPGKRSHDRGIERRRQRGKVDRRLLSGREAVPDRRIIEQQRVGQQLQRVAVARFREVEIAR